MAKTGNLTNNENCNRMLLFTRVSLFSNHSFVGARVWSVLNEVNFCWKNLKDKLQLSQRKERSKMVGQEGQSFFPLLFPLFIDRMQ